ncbi:hypothetical protein [Rhodococcus koreensis]|uniref:hypothetical protein n=1 Tax=Rhodococcus koreensis TaxID=99653 RepID=UPI00366AE06C
MPRRYTTRFGRRSVSYLVHRIFRDGGKVRHETIANLSARPGGAIGTVRGTDPAPVRRRAGDDRGGGGDPVAVAWTRDSGRYARPGAGHTDAALARRPEQRDLAPALTIARVIRPWLEAGAADRECRTTEVNPDRPALFDLGLPPIEYGLLTDRSQCG